MMDLLILTNEKEHGFMVNQAIVDFWKSCDGKKTITESHRSFFIETGFVQTTSRTRSGTASTATVGV